MRRRIFLAVLALAALLGPAAGRAAAQESDRITIDEFKRALADRRPVLVLDVRGQISSKIKGAKHVPLDQLEARLDEIPRGRLIVTYCA